jgi:lipid-A-disaccharide synthase
VSGPLVFLVAGEASGDFIGARLMAALKHRTGGAVRFAGVGGARMAAEGLDSLFPMEELSLFGLAEVLPKIRQLKRRIDQTVAAARDAAPDAVVTIDSPGFNFRVGRRLGADRSFPLIHYVAPTVWAWKPRRAAEIATFLDHLLVLYPFEPPYFEREGLPTDSVGHPVVEAGADAGDGPGFRAAHDLPAEAPLLCVLPGSRRSEVTRLTGPFGATVARLAAMRPDLRVVVPTVPWVEAAVREAAAGWAVPTVVTTGDGPKYDAFAAADAALAASGTVALELALARVPAAVGYRVNWLTAVAGHFLLKTPYVNLVNIMEGREVVPEFLQHRCRSGLLAPVLAPLLDGGPAREAQIAGLATVAERLGQGGPPPSARAADAVLRVIARGRRPG